MNETNILNDLNYKIELLDRSIAELKQKANKEKMEMDEIENQMRMIESKYSLKKIQVNQMKARLDEKIKIASEARKAYSNILNTTTILYNSINKEVEKQ